MSTQNAASSGISRGLTDATVETLGDLYAAERGLMPATAVRRLALKEAIVDRSATFLSLPRELIRQLGLTKIGTRAVANGPGVADLYEAVRLTIQGRSCSMDVMEIPSGAPPVIGNLPLVHLDLVVDPSSRRLIGNPEHGGEHVYELY